MPLTGIRVLDLTRLLPGAFCTQLLADMGAEVVKIEEPGSGDYMRWTPPLVDGQSAMFNAINRRKKSVTLNLKSEEGRQLLLGLVENADVLVEGNRPGVMDRLGLGWPVLHARNPRLVMCSITGYGQDGPFAARAGHDLNYMATAGALGLNGERGGPPLPLSVQVADIRGGGYYSVAALEPKFWTAVCDALARPDLADLQYSEDLDAQKQLEKVFATKTRDEWQEILAGADACCEPVLDLDEVASHPQIAARGVLAPRTDPVPLLGEHSAEILAAAGVDAARLADLRKRGIT